MRNTILLLTCLGLSACDSTFRVRGVAPSSGCLVKVIDENGHVQDSFSVAGPFTKTTIVGGGWGALQFNIEAECGGRVIKSVKAINPNAENYKNAVDLGTIEP